MESYNRAYKRISNFLRLHDYEQKQKNSMPSDSEKLKLRQIALLADSRETMAQVLERSFPFFDNIIYFSS